MLFNQPPPYVPLHVVAQQPLAFRWDDWRASTDFAYDPAHDMEAAATLTPRARAVLTVGLYEWVIWRLRFEPFDPVPFQIAEAAWCALIDPSFMIYDEFEREEWMGPVRGPLWCAMTWLIPAVLDEDPDELESGLSYMLRLAHHVVPDQQALTVWTSIVLQRLKEFFPITSDDPFDDLFNQYKEERRGALVPKEILDPAYVFQPESTRRLLEEFLQTVDFRANPYLQARGSMPDDES